MYARWSQEIPGCRAGDQPDSRANDTRPADHATVGGRCYQARTRPRRHPTPTPAPAGLSTQAPGSGTLLPRPSYEATREGCMPCEATIASPRWSALAPRLGPPSDNDVQVPSHRAPDTPRADFQQVLVQVRYRRQAADTTGKTRTGSSIDGQKKTPCVFTHGVLRQKRSKR